MIEVAVVLFVCIQLVTSSLLNASFVFNVCGKLPDAFYGSIESSYPDDSDSIYIRGMSKGYIARILKYSISNGYSEVVNWDHGNLLEATGVLDSLGNIYYIGGGRASELQSSIYKFTTKENTMTLIANLTWAVRKPLVLNTGKQSFVFNKDGNEVALFDYTSNKVEVVNTLETPIEFRPNVWNGNNAYIFESNGQISKFDPNTYTVTKLEERMNEVLELSKALIIGNKAIIIEGTFGDDSFVDIFDTETEKYVGRYEIQGDRIVHPDFSVVYIKNLRRIYIFVAGQTEILCIDNI